MGVIKINDYINLDIDDLDGALEKVKYYGTFRGYIQRFKISKK